MSEREAWIHALRQCQRINLAKIDATIANAQGVIVPEQVNRLIDLREKSFALFVSGDVSGAMWAGQALFEAANGLQNAIDAEKPLRTGRRVNEGGAEGARRSALERRGQRDEIIALMRNYPGEPRSMAKNVARKVGVSSRYVRKIKKELGLP
jgi:hypothetical protein